MGTNDSSTQGTVYRCNRCNHMWITRKTNGTPRSCPSCRSVIWDKDCKVVRCLRCNHEWTSTKERPTRCPGCHTSRWDSPVEPAVTREPVKVNLDSVIVARVMELYESGLTAFQVSCMTGLTYQSVRAAIGPNMRDNE